MKAQLENLSEELRVKLLFQMSNKGSTALHSACHHTQSDCVNGILESIKKETLHKLLQAKTNRGNDALALSDKQCMEAIMSHLSARFVEDNIPLLTVLARRNKFRLSSYHYSDQLTRNVEVLDKYKEHVVSCEKSLFECFKEFCVQQQTIVHEKRCYDITSVSGAFSTHPLTVIGDAGVIALIKHPYIQAYVDMCWQSFRYIFYANVILYFLFFLMLNVYVISHRFSSESHMTDPNATTLHVSSSMPHTTEACRYGVLGISTMGLLFELLQFVTTRRHYLTLIENYADVVIYICAIIVSILPLTYDYTSHVHIFGLVLIVCAALRGAWMLKLVPYIGEKFRLLLSVVAMVCTFAPVLLFFIIIFAFVFHSLLKHQEPFSHVGFSIVKIVTMSIGEFEFGDVFFNESNLEIFEVITFLLFLLFLVIMTISMTNLLIGYATGDFLGKLIQKGEQWVFKSTVELILQYSYMFPCLRERIYGRKLYDLKKITFEHSHAWKESKDKWERDKYNEELKQKNASFFDPYDKEYKKYIAEMDTGVEDLKGELKEKFEMLLATQKSFEERMLHKETDAIEAVKDDDKHKAEGNNTDKINALMNQLETIMTQMKEIKNAQNEIRKDLMSLKHSQTSYTHV